jgi:hypothetical protein
MMKSATIQNQHLAAKTIRNACVIASLSVISLSSATQAVTLVTDRAALGGNDLLNWSTVAAPFAPLPSAFSTASAGGLGITVNVPPPISPISTPFIFQNGPAISTNFGDGDFVIFTGLNFVDQTGNPGPLTLTFAQPVFAAGAQLLPDAGGSFIGFISAYDLNSTLLASFQLNGVTTTTRDNSAIFLGVSSDTANISRLVFSTSVPNVAIGINQLSILAVPEPPVWPGLLLLAFMLFCLWVSGQRSSQSQ